MDEWNNLAQNVKKAIYKTNESDMKAFDKEEFIILLDTLKNDMSLMDIDSADAVMDELRQYIVPKSIEADLDNLEGTAQKLYFSVDENSNACFRNPSGGYQDVPPGQGVPEKSG